MASLVITTLGVVVAASIVVLIRKDRLHASHGLGWLTVAIGFALLGFTPDFVDRVAEYFGVAYPPILAVLFCISIIVVKILHMDIERSRLEIQNQRLVQRVAMLEERLNESMSGGMDTGSDDYSYQGSTNE